MAPTPAAACRFAAKRSKMTNALDLLLAYPHGLIVTGTVLLILGLIGLALFSPRDVDSAEDPLDDRPKLSDKETQ
jgi:hypothetical protein